MPPIIHRLEWIPALLLWFMLICCRFQDRQTTKINPPSFPYSDSFAETTSIYTVQILVDQHCMTDAKGLCNPSLRRGEDSRCAEPFDPTFVSLLDPYMDANTCTMTIPNTIAEFNISQQNDALRSIIQYTLQEAYSFSRLYFRVKGFQSSEIVNHEDLRRFVFVSLESLTEFFSTLENRKSFFTIADNEKKITIEIWDKVEIIDLMQSIVTDYEDGTDESLLNSDSSKDRFFFDCFLSKVKEYIDSQSEIVELDLLTNDLLEEHPKQILVTNEQLGPCLSYHQDKNSLITEGCSTALNEATLRIQDLLTKETHVNFVFYLQRSYGWISCFLALGIAFFIRKTKSTKEITRWRKYLICHLLFSVSLWVYVYRQGLIGAMGESSFLDSALISLGVFLGTYTTLLVSKSVEEGREEVMHFVIYELPLIEESPDCEEGPTYDT